MLKYAVLSSEEWRVLFSFSESRQQNKQRQFGGRQGVHLRVGGSMTPGERARSRSGLPTVSAMRAVPAPVMDTMSPALAASSSRRPSPDRFHTFVSRPSSPGAPAQTRNRPHQVF